MKTKDRLKAFVKFLDMGQNAFEKEIGIANGYLASKSQTISSDTIEKVVSKYSELSLDWLLTGNGSMLKCDGATSSHNAIKYYPNVDDFMGGVQFLDNPNETTLDLVLPGFSECKYAVNAYGDSMYPVIKSGQIVVLQEWREKFIDWGKIYLVVTKNGYRVIKYVFPSNNNETVLCKSENAENPPFEVEKEEIYKLFLVKGWICRESI